MSWRDFCPAKKRRESCSAPRARGILYLRMISRTRRRMDLFLSSFFLVSSAHCKSFPYASRYSSLPTNQITSTDMGAEAQTTPIEITKKDQTDPSEQEQEKQSPPFDSKENQTRNLPQTPEKTETQESAEAQYAEVQDAEAQPSEYAHSHHRGNSCCKCVFILLLIFIIIAALAGGLITYGSMGCFKSANKNKKKCRPKGQKSDAGLVSVRGSWQPYMVMFLFEVIMFLMF